MVGLAACPGVWEWSVSPLTDRPEFAHDAVAVASCWNGSPERLCVVTSGIHHTELPHPALAASASLALGADRESVCGNPPLFVLVYTDVMLYSTFMMPNAALCLFGGEI